MEDQKAENYEIFFIRAKTIFEETKAETFS